MATFGLNNGGPYWPLAAFQFLMFWCILVDSCSSSISFWHFSHFHAQPKCGPNVSKCYVDWTWQGSGATPKSAGVAGEIGLMPVQHWYLRAGWELLCALLGSFGIVKKDTWWCLLCFYLLCFYFLCFYFYHSFVCFCSRKRPWDMRPLGRARAPQWWDSWPLLLCQLHEATADQSERLQEEVGCQLWSVQIWWQWQVHYIYEPNSGDLFVFVCFWQVQSLRTAEAAAAQKVQELQQLLAEASSDNPDSNRQEHVCGLLPWVATRRRRREYESCIGVAFHDVWEEFWSEMQSSQASGIGGWASCFYRRRDTGEVTAAALSRGRGGSDDGWCLARVSIASIACMFVEFFWLYFPLLSGRLFG